MRIYSVKRTIIRAYSYAIAFFLVAVGFGTTAYYERITKERFTDSVYNRAFSELVDYMSNINISLNKAMYVTSPTQLVTLSADIYRQSSSAKSDIGQLPITNVNLDKMHKFLSQTGDYIYMLTKKIVNGDTINQEERDNLKTLSTYADKISSHLILMQDIIYKSPDKMGAVINLLNSEKTDNALSDISDINYLENIFIDYPKLIYDGPFSEVGEVNNYYLLNNSQPISEKESKKTIDELFSKSIKILKSENNSDFKVYGYMSDNAYAEISVNGGYLIRMSIDKPIGESILNENEVLTYIDDFLGKMGYNSLTQTYYIEEEGMLTANYAHVQESVYGQIICYSDLIKIGATMDNGKVCFFEAESYLKNHIFNRELPSEIISKDEALTKISNQLLPRSVRLAFIPTDYNTEILCYEIVCENEDGKYYISYINAENGAEEDFLVILDTGHGTLTM